MSFLGILEVVYLNFCVPDVRDWEAFGGVTRSMAVSGGRTWGRHRQGSWPLLSLGGSGFWVLPRFTGGIARASRVWSFDVGSIPQTHIVYLRFSGLDIPPPGTTAVCCTLGV